jgi:B9 domain-containing protein 2
MTRDAHVTRPWHPVWCMDRHGARDLAGYGFCHVPTSAGMHEVDVVTWCPEGTSMEKLTAFFVARHVWK